VERRSRERDGKGKREEKEKKKKAERIRKIKKREIWKKRGEGEEGGGRGGGERRYIRAPRGVAVHSRRARRRIVQRGRPPSPHRLRPLLLLHLLHLHLFSLSLSLSLLPFLSASRDRYCPDDLSPSA